MRTWWHGMIEKLWSLNRLTHFAGVFAVNRLTIPLKISGEWTESLTISPKIGWKHLRCKVSTNESAMPERIRIFIGQWWHDILVLFAHRFPTSGHKIAATALKKVRRYPRWPLWRWGSETQIAAGDWFVAKKWPSMKSELSEAWFKGDRQWQIAIFGAWILSHAMKKIAVCSSFSVFIWRLGILLACLPFLLVDDRGLESG